MEAKFRKLQDEIAVNGSTIDRVSLCEPHEFVKMIEYAKELDSRDPDSWIGAFTLMSIFYNYPPCCIIAGIEDLDRNTDPDKRRLDESGFIPCQKHYEEYQNKVEMLHKLRVVYPKSAAMLSIKAVLRMHGRRGFERLEVPHDKRLLYDELIKNKKELFY